MRSGSPAPSAARSGVAILAGFVMVTVLSLGSDMLCHRFGFAPALSEPWPNSALTVAAIYRAVYGVLAGLVTARLAPWRPVKHAVILGLIGLILSSIGVVVAWRMQTNLGAHVYSIIVMALTLPASWAGGKLAELRFASRIR